MFKKGDLIKGKNNTNYSITNELMSLGIVVREKIDSINRMELLILKHTDTGEIGKTYKVFNKEDEFDLVDNDNDVKIEYVKKKEDYVDKSDYDFTANDYVKLLTPQVLAKKYGYFKIKNKKLYDTPYGLVELETFKDFADIELKVVETSTDFIYVNTKNRRGVDIPKCLVAKIKAKKKKVKKVIKTDDKEDEIVQEMLSKVDKAKVLKIFASVLQKAPKDLKGVDLILENWAKAKKDLYLLLDRNLKIETDMEYDADTSFYSEKIRPLYSQYPSLLLLTKIMGGMDYLVDASKRDEFNYSTLNECGIKSGTKMSKVLSKVVNDPNFDTEYSKLLEQAKVKGKVALSIDPVDIMLMSFNNSGWTSCHTISRDGRAKNWGEWSGGIFSYIADSCTMIAYRYSGTQVEYKLGSNTITDISKNWRELFYVDTENGTFIASRQYPNYIEEISKVAREMLELQISKAFGVENNWKVSRQESESYFRNYIKDYHTTNFENILQYNDMLHGYNGKVAYNKNIKDTFTMNIMVGGKAICPICGEEEIEHSSTIVGDNCLRDMR